MPAQDPVWQQRFRAPIVQFPAWSRSSPDRLVVLSDESGSDQVYVWDLATGTRKRVSDEPVGVIHGAVTAEGDRAVWFRDESGDESGAWVAVAFEGGAPAPLLPGAPAGWPEGIAFAPRIVAAVLADRSGFGVYASVDGGPAKELYRDVDAVVIGQTEWEHEGQDRSGLSADGSLLCVSVAQDGDNLHHALLVLDVRTGAEAGRLADGPGLDLQALAWSPIRGDLRLALSHERHDRLRPAVWDPSTGGRTDLDVDLPGQVLPVDWWPDAGSLLLLHRHDGRDGLYRYEIGTGTLAEVLPPSGEIHGAAVRPDGRVWFRVSSGGTPPHIVDDLENEVLRAEGPASPGGRPYRSFHCTNASGDRVHGFVVLPEGEPPFPTYMKVHGGPNWLYLDTWWRDVQAYVDHGIAVAMVNYRGSTGYGRAWRDHIIGNIGFPEVEDTMAGLDHLIAEGIADPDRAAIGGWSWGGYTTLLAIGLHPDRFVCAVGGVPVGDYAASYHDSAPDLQAYDRSLLGGTVYEVPDLVRERSPITYADRVKTPTLVMVGEHDTRCPPQQALNWVDAVRAAGGDVEVYAFGAGHVSYVVDEEIRQTGEILGFLLRHLRPGA
ncbi:MAG TPA: prolyl oligopeptidase family serine peptidase [Actinomycetota bacterium]